MLLIAVVIGLLAYYYYTNRKEEGFDTYVQPSDPELRLPHHVTFADKVEEIGDDDQEFFEDRRKENDFPSIPKAIAEDDDPLMITGYHVGLDSRGSSMKNGNLTLRRDPFIPKEDVLWGASTIEPDLLRKPLI